MESFEPFEQFESEAGAYEKEVERIREVLEKYLGRGKAKEVATSIHTMALDIDESIHELKRDPSVLKRYSYDGQFFEDKEGGRFYKTLDGIHFLKLAPTAGNIRAFVGPEGKLRLDQLLGWLKAYVWVAETRLEGWRKFGNLSLTDREDIKQIIEKHKSGHGKHPRQLEEAGPAPLSEEEIRFFEQYEKQIKSEK